MRIGAETKGVYSISGRFTKANDYGKFQLYVNRQKIGKPIDCYNAGPYPISVINSGDVNLGIAHLHAGVNEFEFEVIGKSAASNAHMMGIDELRLLQVDDQGQ